MTTRTPVEATRALIAQPIDTAPRDGRTVLVFGTCAWESLSPHSHTGKPEWRVAEWVPDLGWDDEDFQPIGGWKSVTSNPYADYIIATAWTDLPVEI
jgi:hypothetical protein